MSKNFPAISVVVPVYNEESNVPLFLDTITPVLEALGSYEIIFSLDPSTDNTENLIRKYAEANSAIKSIVFSRKIGQPMAVIAGVLNCNGDHCVIIDVDLQDPPELISAMYEKINEGCDVVYAKRLSSNSETLAKRFISHLGYKIINMTATVDIPRNTGDFRMISRRVIEELRRFPESHGFLRGLVAIIGFKQDFVEFDREKRAGGTSKYNPFFGSLKIGLNGLFGFSSFFLSLSLMMGILIAALSFLGALIIIISKLYFLVDYPVGTPTLIVTVLFMGGVQLISVGIIGEYIGRIYDEVKGRPRFIIDKTINVDKVLDDGSR